MTKITAEQLEYFRSLDRAAFDFSNDRVTEFFEQASEHGYSRDTASFLKHPGFFQAPHRQVLDAVDIAIVGSPLDLGAIGLSGTRHGPKAIRESSRNYGPVHDVTGNIAFSLWVSATTTQITLSPH
jgi:hypothetical protein